MIGFDCWHDYPSNPRTIDLSLSKDGQYFFHWATLNCDKVMYSIYDREQGSNYFR